ncbi:MAG TPA: sugar ABC transporter permease [Spirochaetia bacterium]|nr:sugar ABC transporter permease [Spirochaetia bacterium]
MYKRTQSSQRRRNVRKSRFVRYGYVLPSVVLLLLFFFSPVGYNIWLSLQKISLFQLKRGGTFIGIDNYVRLFGSQDFWLSLWNTVFWLTIVTVAIRIVLGLGLALLVESRALRRWHLSGLARSMLLIPWITPPVVAVAAWQWLLEPRYGVLNQIIVGLGIAKQGIPFLVQTSTVWIGIVILIVWRELPFVAISLLSGLKSIPEELYESARVEGANSRQTFFHITLPLLRPILTVVTLLITIWTFNNFLYVWLTTGGGPGNFTQVLATLMYTESFVKYDLGYGATVGVTMTLIMLIFSIVYLRSIFRRNLEENR